MAMPENSQRSQKPAADEQSSANVCPTGTWHGAPPPPNQNPGYAGAYLEYNVRDTVGNIEVAGRS